MTWYVRDGGKRRVGQKVKPKTLLPCAIQLAVNAVKYYAMSDGRATVQSMT